MDDRRLPAIRLTPALRYGAPRRIVRALACAAVALVAPGLPDLHGAMPSAQAQPPPARQAPGTAAAAPSADIDDDKLWNAQPTLLAAARAALPPPAPGRANVYAVAVAASGSQALFSREAREALRVAALHFGPDGRGGTLLSNGAADLLHVPMATRENIAAIARAIGEKADPRRDLLFLYLASHGGRRAQLASEVSPERVVEPISALSTARALKTAGVARRVIVVSACFAASWIPALADDDTIVIAAAARDRTSFGCDDTRLMTFFGEAFLGSLAEKDISLHDAFENAKRRISVEERQNAMTPSLPQAFVGRDMQALWLARSGGGAGA